MFVRTDMPIEQILVQACHAAQESGLAFPNPTPEPNSLIVLQVKNKEQLEAAHADMQSKGIRLVRFDEPSWDYGFTAFASEPVYQHQRKNFKRYQLFKGGAK